MNAFTATLGAAAIAGALLASTAAAQSAAIRQSLEPIRQFERADTDGDKDLSWEEFYNYTVQLFHEWDTNGDGMILDEEHGPAVDAQGRPVRPQGVSLEAFTVEVRKAFKLADKDKSGKLSYAEAAGG
jgi:hypothetical protein